MAQRQRKPEKKNEGGSGGGGGDDGGGDDDGDDDDNVPMSRSEVLKLVNGAVSGQLARKLPAAIEAGIAPILTKLDGLKKPADDEGGNDDDDEEVPPAKKPNKPDPATSKLSKQVDNLTRQLKERDDKLLKEEAARKGALIDSALGTALAELGVEKHRMRGALAVHKASAFVDDTGSVKYKLKRDGYDEDLDPSEALKEWGSTDEGKSYIAASGSAGGAGARAPRQSGPGRKPAANTPEAKAEKVREAKSDLLGAVGELVAGGVIAIE